MLQNEYLSLLKSHNEIRQLDRFFWDFSASDFYMLKPAEEIRQSGRFIEGFWASEFHMLKNPP